MTLRFAGQGDVPALLAVYQHAIPTSITFEYELPSVEEFARRVDSISRIYPYLAAEEEGAVTGYAYAHRIALISGVLTAGGVLAIVSSTPAPPERDWAPGCTGR